jgi:hypothetical protein
VTTFFIKPHPVSVGTYFDNYIRHFIFHLLAGIVPEFILPVASYVFSGIFCTDSGLHLGMLCKMHWPSGNLVCSEWLGGYTPYSAGCFLPGVTFALPLETVLELQQPAG